MNTNYKELLNVLTVKQLKTLIRDYMNHMKITVSKKKKNELISHLLEHTEIRNEKIVLKDNFKRDLPKPNEKVKKQQPKPRFYYMDRDFAGNLSVYERGLEEDKEILKYYGFYDDLIKEKPTQDNIKKLLFNYYSRRDDSIDLTRKLIEKYDMLLKDNKELLEKKKIKFNYLPEYHRDYSNTKNKNYYTYLKYERDKDYYFLTDSKLSNVYTAKKIVERIKNIKNVINELKENKPKISKSSYLVVDEWDTYEIPILLREWDDRNKTFDKIMNVLRRLQKKKSAVIDTEILKLLDNDLIEDIIKVHGVDILFEGLERIVKYIYEDANYINQYTDPSIKNLPLNKKFNNYIKKEILKGHQKFII